MTKQGVVFDKLFFALITHTEKVDKIIDMRIEHQTQQINVSKINSFSKLISFSCRVLKTETE